MKAPTDSASADHSACAVQSLRAQRAARRWGRRAECSGVARAALGLPPGRFLASRLPWLPRANPALRRPPGHAARRTT